jgi:nicotinamide riboside transporter PnuC
MKKKGRFTTVHVIKKSLRHHVIEWAAMVMSVVGAIMNAQLNIWGFYVFILGNILWASFSIKHRHWGLLATQFVFFALNIYGIFVWMHNPALA